ncbi:hypothetical protein F444_15440 [Phytophthora nicotianae P1976]|uniref:Uncharacterized protein n=1 Tax=Phytophthora nicotianae P1976 TaxID=1317066 RepID=A0A080ZLZ2_PHYNI|nr:hypothetical protein F444_15440 [Phytophthora nicotianae P1976]
MAHVVACRFLRLGCSEEDHPLFRREYARNNRERGVKLLRCFPHCCPEHARRSYCGCSVHVLVTFSGDARTIPLDKIVVCARFEPTRVVPLWPAGLVDLARTVGATGDRQENKCKLDIGERVVLPESLFGSAARTSSDGGEWILAERESDTNQQTVPQNSVLYVLNNRVSPKWFYSYDSSVTRTQREMTHHLVAYIFQALPGRLPMAQQINQQTPNVVVLARHASPGFFLVSYRRSGGSSGNPGCPLPAIETPADNMEVASSQILSASWKVQEHQQQHLQQQQWLQQQRFQQRLRIEQEARQKQQIRLPYPSIQGVPSASAPFDRDLSMQTIRDKDGSDNQTHAADLTTPSEVADVMDLWQQEVEATAPGFLEKGQQLFILWYFVENVSVDDLGVNWGSFEAHVRSHWLRTAAALHAPSLVSNDQLEGVIVSFLRKILDITPSQSHANNEHTTIRLCGYLFIRALWSRAAQQRLSVACQVEDGGMSKREKFATAIVDLWGILNDILREVMGENTGGESRPLETATLPVLVDDVMSIAYKQTRFREARAKISTLLLELQTPNSLTGAVNRAFRAFTVQFQDTITVSERDFQSLRNSQWCRRWLLEPGSFQVAHVESGARYSSPLLSMALLIREFGCIDVKMTQDAVRSMSLRAAITLSSGMTTSHMKLVLDGRIRVFRALPSGISSRIAGGGVTVGDYSATFSQDGQSIDLHFFTFDERGNMSSEEAVALNTALVHRISLSLALDQEADAARGGAQSRDLFIIIHGTVCRSRYSSSREGTRASGLKISDMSSCDRAMLWNQVDWTPLLQIQAGYVAL